MSSEACRKRFNDAWRSPDSRLGQEGNSKECNFPRMYFVLSVVSTMNFLVKADYQDTEATIDIAFAKRPHSCTVNFDDLSTGPCP